MGELGAEAQVGVEEVEQEVEGPLLDKVGDEPENIQGVPKNALSECCWSSAERPRVRLP